MLCVLHDHGAVGVFYILVCVTVLSIAVFMKQPSFVFLPAIKALTGIPFRPLKRRLKNSSIKWTKAGQGGAIALYVCL